MERNVLILGSGYISGCLIHYLTKISTHPKHNVCITLGSCVSKELDDIKSKFNNIRTVLVDVLTDKELALQLIKNSDLVISMVPNNLQYNVAVYCVEAKVNMIHASYNTPKMNDLDGKAKDANVLILGEMGLDPGIDHLLAMKCVDEIIHAKGRIHSFTSYCGGLPAPDCKDNVLRYKFSWSPKTALANLMNSARYLKNKTIVEVGAGRLLDATEEIDFLQEFHLEGYPNRDSLVYLDKYSIPYVKNIFRGTLRYRGFAQAAKVLMKLGLFGDEPLNILDPDGEYPPISWREFVAYLLWGPKAKSTNTDSLDAIKRQLQDDFKVVESLGLVSEDLVDKLHTPVNSLSKHLERTLQYRKGEQDIVILHHELEVTYPVLGIEGRRKEFREIDFIVYGDPVVDNIGSPEQGCSDSYSAMAKTVAYTVGIGAEMILNGDIKATGVTLPLTQDIYVPILEKLSELGFFAIERIS